jgi:hypothetical protein
VHIDRNSNRWYQTDPFHWSVVTIPGDVGLIYFLVMRRTHPALMHRLEIANLGTALLGHNPGWNSARKGHLLVDQSRSIYVVD